MNVNIVSGSEAKTLELESLITPARQVVWIGRNDESVYNTVTVECEDVFLCSVSFLKDTGNWVLTRGQVRTHCPRGLVSDRAKACSMCRGCCVNVRTANPDYSLRVPKGRLLVNGIPVTDDGIILKEDDAISFE